MSADDHLGEAVPSDFAHMPDKALSRVEGLPISEEPGIGALTLTGWLLEVTEVFGEREALVQPLPDGGFERWSYNDLRARSIEVARALCAQGLGKGGRVGILMTNRLAFIAAFFGTVLAGGVATPLSTFSTAAELEQLIMSSGCSALLIEPVVLKTDFIAMLGALEPATRDSTPGPLASIKFPFLNRIVALDIDTPEGAVEPWAQFLARGQAVSEAHVLARAATVTPADPAALFFSSGSTGAPKGILNAHRGVAIQFWRWPRIWGMDGPTRCWVANGFFWSAPCAMGIGGALSLGGTLVLQSTFRAAEALALMAAERVECPIGWPHQWAQLADAANWNDVDLSALRYIAPDNPLSEHPTVRRSWPEPTRIYGNSETFTLSTGYCAGTSDALLEGAHGFPLPGMTVKIVDPVSGNVVPTGQRGELAVKGATLMLGYVGIPLDETLDGEGFFRTGDGAFVDGDGRVYWEGRLNDIIKTGGANVSPVEVDAVLQNCPGVKIAKTVGVKDVLLGEVVVSCIVPHAEGTIDEEQVRAFGRQRLASYKMPRHILFLTESDLATTGSAKVKTADLRVLAAERLSSAGIV